MTARISDLTAVDLGRMYADGSLSPVEVARAPSGLPVGLQIVGNAFADRLVLSAARAYEKVRSAISPLPACND
jgi:hypothetical protein